jgi:hypothetical protein
MIVKCKNCEKEFNRKPSMIKSENIYCNLLCRDAKSYKNNFIKGLTEKQYLEQNYIVNKDGSIINKRTNKEVKFSLTIKGYLKARLHTPLSKNPDGRKPYSQHRIIAMFYLEDYSNELQVNHKNGIKTDNRVENLEMVTCSENMRHSWNELGRELKINRDENGKFLNKK